MRRRQAGSATRARACGRSGRDARARVRTAVLIAGAALLVSAPATAHEVGLSRGEYRLESGVVTAQLTFARGEVIGLVAGLDADHDGALTAAEVSAARASIEGAVAGRLKVSGDGAPCAPTLLDAALADEDGLTVRALYRCRSAVPSVTVDLTLLDDLAFGHRHLARLDGPGNPSFSLLFRRERTFSLPASPPGSGPALPAPDAAADPSSTSSPAVAPRVPPFLGGAASLIHAPDPLLFLLALALGRAAPRRLALAVVAFTAAALLALLAGALGAWAPGAVVLGPALALSVAYLALDNLAPDATAQRAPLALIFGAVHGAAFAALRSRPPGALPAFAAGVGASTLLAGLALIALVAAARRRLVAAARIERAVSALVLVVALVTVALRLLGR